MSDIPKEQSKGHVALLKMSQKKSKGARHFQVSTVEDTKHIGKDCLESQMLDFGIRRGLSSSLQEHQSLVPVVHLIVRRTPNPSPCITSRVIDLISYSFHILHEESSTGLFSALYN